MAQARFESLGQSDSMNVFDMKRGCEYEIYGQRFIRTDGGAVAIDGDGGGGVRGLAAGRFGWH